MDNFTASVDNYPYYNTLFVAGLEKSVQARLVEDKPEVGGFRDDVFADRDTRFCNLVVCGDDTDLMSTLETTFL